MSNEQIISTVQLAHEIAEICHTYAHWQTLGRQVKKGEKALFKAPMWKPNTKTGGAEQGAETIYTGKFFSKTSAFFGLSQTEQIGREQVAG